MTISEADNKARLFALDAALRAEADVFLKDSGLGKIIKDQGFHPVGSYVMKTMTWRDLDFERYDESPGWQKHWEFGAKLAQLKWVWRLAAINGYLDPRKTDEGLYWGLRASPPGEKNLWKLDLWTARREEFVRSSPKRPLWEKPLDDDKRYDILVIKEAVCMLPEYKDSLLSIYIYEAVLEAGVHGIDEFWLWWNNHSGI